MKRYLLVLLISIPFFASAQFDFETRYFTITADALPEIEELTSISLYKGPAFSSKLPSFKMTRSNYWQPVDMSSAIEKTSEYVDSKIEIAPTIKSREFGFSFSVNGNNSFDNTSSGGIKNIAYQEMRSLYFCTPTPSSSIAGRRN